MVEKTLTAPDPQLRAISQPVDPNDPDLPRLIKDLKDTLTASQIPGLGLSAPQIGVEKRVFVARSSNFQPQTSHFTVFINPEIVWSSRESNIEAQKSESLYLEGCLSIPNIYALIKRPYEIRVQWQSFQPPRPRRGEAEGGPTSSLISNLKPPTSNLQSFEYKFKGFNATLIQHEIDHLDGILFTDHAAKQGATIYEDRKGELQEILI